MTFEFVIVYQRQVGEVPLHFQLSERISQVLTDSLNEYDFKMVEGETFPAPLLLGVFALKSVRVVRGFRLN